MHDAHLWMLFGVAQIHDALLVHLASSIAHAVNGSPAATWPRETQRATRNRVICDAHLPKRARTNHVHMDDDGEMKWRERDAM